MQQALIALAPWATRQPIRSIHRHHNKNRLINGMYYMPCFVMLVLSVITAKIHFEEQEPVAETKQQSKADKAVKFGSFVLPATSACSMYFS